MPIIHTAPFAPTPRSRARPGTIVQLGVAVWVGLGLGVEVAWTAVGVAVGVGDLVVGVDLGVAVMLGLGNGLGQTVLLGSSSVTKALVVPAANALLPNWKALLVTGKSPEKVKP